VQQHQREQSHRFRFRQQFDEQSPQPDRFIAQIVANGRCARRSGVALVEHEIDDVQHGVEAIGQLLASGHLIRNLRVANLALGSNDALRDGGRRGQEGARDFFRRQAAHFAQRERDARIGLQAGWQHVKMRRSRSSFDRAPDRCRRGGGAIDSICAAMSARAASNRAARRSLSMALNRPVDTSHARGLAGTPSAARSRWPP
jgi:hypothetical protein